jgi:hypothetical protein
MKLNFIDAGNFKRKKKSLPVKKKKYSRSKETFLAYFCQNMMDITSSESPWSKDDQIKERYRISKIYRRVYNLHRYSIVQIWKSLNRTFERKFDDILYLSMEMEKDILMQANVVIKFKL